MKHCFKKHIMTCMITILLAAGGCGAVEPEKRDYPLALAWDYEDGNYSVVYGMANLQEVTEQDKGNQDTDLSLKVQGQNLEEIRANYARSQQYYLDLGHVKAIIFSERLLNQPKAYQNLMEDMQKSTEIGKNAYVFMTDSMEDVMKTGAQKEDGLGQYLTGIYDNHEGARQKGVTLEDIYYDWNNEERITQLPQLKVEEGKVILCENL